MCPRTYMFSPKSLYVLYEHIVSLQPYISGIHYGQTILLSPFWDSRFLAESLENVRLFVEFRRMYENGIGTKHSSDAK